jgi:hypothetical protein
MSAFTRYWLRTREQKVGDAIACGVLTFGLALVGGAVYVCIHFARKYW